MAPPLPMSEASRALLTKVIPVLSPLAEATTMLSVDNEVGISLVQPCIKELNQHLQNISSESSTTGISKLHTAIMKQISNRFDLNAPHLVTSTFLDPRLKTATLNDDNLATVTETICKFVDDNPHLHVAKKGKFVC